jgi:cell division GTPase FtsZ
MGVSELGGEGKRSLHIGVVGLGQCGGSFAEQFAERGYPALAVNGSRADLRALGRLDEARKLAVGSDGFYGAGGSLSLGGEALRAGLPAIEHKALELFEDVELLLVVGGLGGGTGGNLAELVAALTAQDFPVVALGVLPGGGEGHRPKTNALWAINELVESDADSLIFVDNDKLFGAYGGEGIGRFYAKCNAAVVDAVDALNSVSANPDLASVRTFDPNDLRQLLRFGGVTVFGSRDIEGKLGGDALARAFRDVVNRNDISATGFDLADVVMVGSIITAGKSVLDDTPASSFDDFQREVKQLTSGAMHRSGIYLSTGQPARLHVVATGLPLPSRVRELLAEASGESHSFNEKKASARARLAKLDLSALGVSDPVPTARAVAADRVVRSGVTGKGSVAPMPVEDGELQIVDAAGADGEESSSDEALEATGR